MIDRRAFLKISAAAGASLLPGCKSQSPGPLGPTTQPASRAVPQVRVLMVEPDGSPLEKVRAATLCARDLANDPLPQAIASAEGRSRVDLSDEPIQVTLRLKVPDFGEVYCWADNDGRGYTKPANIEFVVDAAATRLRRVREEYQRARHEGATIESQTEYYLLAAARPIPKGPKESRCASAYQALSAGLHAGEQLALARAQNRISRFSKPRSEFYFGAMVSGFDRLGPTYEKLIRERFNFATVSWYAWQNEQPVEQRINYDRMDRSMKWCLDRGIEPKAFGYCYMTRGATPEWLRTWPFEKIVPEYQRVITQTMKRYAPRLKYAEILNEAHDKANLWKLSHAQILEIAKASCQAARDGSPTVQRQINHCCMWAEYAKKANDDGSRRWSPYRFVRDCINSGVEYETIGLQLYYPQVDLMEIDRMLDRFKDFNKPIHITEIATASEPTPDPKSMRPNNTPPGWHNEWSEQTQADWLEGVYTMLYSKPEFEAVGWWDMVDIGGHFWPHGGLLKADLTPKLAYHRLGELQKKWGVGAKPV